MPLLLLKKRSDDVFWGVVFFPRQSAYGHEPLGEQVLTESSVKCYKGLGWVDGHEDRNAGKSCYTSHT